MDDTWYMRRALELAARGEGAVEPNPMVGCVIAHDSQVIGEGWHERFGRPHAEVVALERCVGSPAGATLYVTLEPCCHQGKTPPCTAAIKKAGIRRVVAAMQDPFAEVAGQGFAELRAAGIDVEVGLLDEDARQLNAPYLKLLDTGRPWVIAKWAMSLDGKIATRAGESRWISGETSREVVHRLRGRVDAILVGSRTAALDDPLLTARPAGARVATRIVLDTLAKLNSESQLVRTATDGLVLVVAGPGVEVKEIARLERAGCEVLRCQSADQTDRLCELLDELGRRRMTNLLVEGGGTVLGALLDAGQIDEVHVFIAPKLIGGAGATGPLAGLGVEHMPDALRLASVEVSQCGEDAYIRGRIAR